MRLTRDPSDPPGCTCNIVPSPKTSFQLLLVALQCCALQKLPRGFIFLSFLPFLQQSKLAPVKSYSAGYSLYAWHCEDTLTLCAVNPLESWFPPPPPLDNWRKWGMKRMTAWLHTAKGEVGPQVLLNIPRERTASQERPELEQNQLLLCYV